MDALKFALEILIVGALALPWLAVLIHIFSPSDGSTHPVEPLDSFVSVVPTEAQNAVGMMLIIAVGYLLGSAVSRISRNFFNDETLRTLPTEDQIRDNVYYSEYCVREVLEPGRPGAGSMRSPTELCKKTTTRVHSAVELRSGSPFRRGSFC